METGRQARHVFLRMAGAASRRRRRWLMSENGVVGATNVAFISGMKAK